MTYRRFGPKRMRALEVLKELIQTGFATKGPKILNLTVIMRKQIVSTMLNVLETYDFSNVASQLALSVLDLLKTAYDLSDLAQLKAFVQRNLSSRERTSLRFDSGRLTHKGSLAAIVKMALVLKKLTLEAAVAPSPAAKKAEAESSEEEA